jgi:hypothetical protein
MFGYDDAELERIRRGPPRLRPWVVLVQIVFAAVPCALALALGVLNDPARINALLHRYVPTPAFEFGFEEVELLPVGSWRHPLTWRVAVTGFWFRPTDVKKPDWRVERATIDAPEPLRSAGGWVLRSPSLIVTGLAIRAHQQRPPEPWTPKEGLVHALMVDVVQIRAASFESPEDPPLGLARATSIRGTLHDLLFLPGERLVSGKGAVKLATFTTGDITVEQGDLTTFELDRSTLRIEGTYVFAGARGWVKGEIRTFHVRSDVDLHTILTGASVSQVIETATGSDSNLDGRLDLDLRVEAGGDRPRGASKLWGTVAVNEGRIQLGRDTRYVVLDALRLLPWVDLNAYNQVELRPLEGRIELQRGRVTLMDWRYPVGKRSIQVDGTVEAGDLYLFVRLLPREDRPDGRPLGLMMWGTAKQQQFKLADRDALARPDPWVKVVPVEAKDVPESPRRAARRAERDKPDP